MTFVVIQIFAPIKTIIKTVNHEKQGERRVSEKRSAAPKVQQKCNGISRNYFSGSDGSEDMGRDDLDPWEGAARKILQLCHSLLSAPFAGCYEESRVVA